MLVSVIGRLRYVYHMHIMEPAITWNRAKERANRLKHRIRFSEVEPVFHDPHAILLEDKGAEGEERLVVIGLDMM
jgi:uncharacterized DUF497 family protein